jgi:amino acid transporter
MGRHRHSDIENGSVFKYRDHIAIPDYSSQFGEPNYEETTIIQQSVASRIWESFQRNPDLFILSQGETPKDGRTFDARIAAARTANSPLSRSLKSRHLQLIAIAGSIGLSTYL